MRATFCYLVCLILTTSTLGRLSGPLFSSMSQLHTNNQGVAIAPVRIVNGVVRTISVAFILSLYCKLKFRDAKCTGDGEGRVRNYVYIYIYKNI